MLDMTQRTVSKIQTLWNAIGQIIYFNTEISMGENEEVERNTYKLRDLEDISTKHTMWLLFRC